MNVQFIRFETSICTRNIILFCRASNYSLLLYINIMTMCTGWNVNKPDKPMRHYSLIWWQTQNNWTSSRKSRNYFSIARDLHLNILMSLSADFGKISLGIEPTKELFQWQNRFLAKASKMITESFIPWRLKLDKLKWCKWFASQ